MHLAPEHVIKAKHPIKTHKNVFKTCSGPQIQFGGSTKSYQEYLKYIPTLYWLEKNMDEHDALFHQRTKTKHTGIFGRHRMPGNVQPPLP